MLIDLECEINVTNIYGQKALYWIISKCPQIVILNHFYYNSKIRNLFYFNLSQNQF